MALSLVRPKDIQPPESPDEAPRLGLSISRQSGATKIDAATLLSTSLEHWRDEHAVLFKRQLEARGAPMTADPPPLQVELAAPPPDMNLIDAVLAIDRRVEVTFVPHREGSLQILVHHPESGETLSFPCEPKVTFHEKEISATEDGLLRQSFQTTLAARFNSFFERLIRDADGDPSTPRPVCMVTPDPDLARLVWTPAEVARGYRILRGEEAQTALSHAPDFKRPNARDVETSDFVIILIPHVKVTEDYRHRMTELAKVTYRSHLSPAARVSSLFGAKNEGEQHLVQIVDRLLGIEIGVQAAKDPAAIAYAKKVGADPEAIKERARKQREEGIEAAQKLQALREEIRAICNGVLEDPSILQRHQNLIINTQGSLLAAISKGRTERALECIEDALKEAPAEVQHPLNELKRVVLERHTG